MFNYAILGSGRQGIAAAYDLIKFGNSKKVYLYDINLKSAIDGSEKLNNLIQSKTVLPGELDVSNHKSLVNCLKNIDVFISAVPYHLNPKITKAALESCSSMVDLGGHTDNVRQQLSYHKSAKEKNITIVPDCGMGPGMNISMALLGMEQMDSPEEVRIWDGGLPQNPKPPWNYNLFFHINGLTNEYHGSAYFIRDRKIKLVNCFDDIEILDFSKPIGRLEAAVTSGGLSTMPWTFENKINLLENKTLRYPGHWEWMKAYRELGLFNENTIKYNKTEIIPRDFYHYFLEKKLNKGLIKDVCIMRVLCKGTKNEKPIETEIESIEYYDDKIDFTAMEKWTGWHASIMAIQIANRRIMPGAYPVELALSGKDFYKEGIKRGFNIQIRTKLINENN